MKIFPLLAVTVLSFHSPVCVAEESEPNVLLICVDDLRTELGCYGSKIVISPNIDRFSASGVTFDNCYVQVAVCNPSRASMMTGLRPDTLGCWTLDYHFRETKPEAVTLPQYLRRHGYHAEGYGKIFHNPWPDPRSWSRRHRFGPGNWNHYSGEQEDFVARVKDSLPDDDWRKGNLRGPITNAPDIEDGEHPDAAMADIVVERLAALKGGDEPFFLAAGFILPHLPWCPPKKYWDLYDRDSLPLADHRELPRDIPDVALGTNYEFTHYADAIDTPAPLTGEVSDETARRFRHAYLASVSFVDAQIGRILEALDANELGEKTVVVLWSDHGYKLGEHRGWGKMTNSEFDTRIPFIVRDPRAEANGQRCERLVETLDLFPTLCELAGVAAPGFTEGKSFAPLLDDPDAEHIDAAYSQYIYKPLIGASVRTEDWRYTEWRKMETGAVEHTELYDHRADDHAEDTNLAGTHPEIEAVLAERLRRVLPAGPVELLPEIHSAKGDEKISVEFVNRHSGEVRLTWISPQGKRAQEYNLAKGRTRTINTFVGHVFVAESLDGRYHEIHTVDGDESEIELGTKPSRKIAEVLSPPPTDWNVPDFYAQAIEADGYPIVASKKVNPYALREAAWIVGGLLKNIPDVRQAMIDSGSRLSILAPDEFTTDLPEFAKEGPGVRFRDLDLCGLCRLKRCFLQPAENQLQRIDRGWLTADRRKN